MKYNFDKIVERRGTNCYKWDDTAEGVIPMWIADMDFQTAPFIIEALHNRVEHGIFGYTKVPDSYFEAVVNWFKNRHGWKNLQKEWILYTSGVVPALSAVIKAFTQPGDHVIVQTPVYNCFFSSIRNNGCEVVENKLIYEHQSYRMDFVELERLAADPKSKLLLLCNPHNPAGRVWTKDELLKLGEICMRHHVLVVSDEIHCEFVFPDHQYIPFASINEELQKHSITCNAPSKAFNTAGLQIANIISDNPDYRQRIDRAININEVCDVNPFGVIALQAAYTSEGEEWLEQLNKYLYSNYNYLKYYFTKEIPQFPITKLEGTYLAWIDCSAAKCNSKQITDYLTNQFQVQVNEGHMYGDDRFIRINLACPREILEAGLKRIVKGLQQLC
ncbi:MAG: pyridoxal phosphate-dependent aminotransferase [Bacteroidaceae bacterium]|nr:pyridoxal phosphate-dependent aminotransferase [Bacteroidaceae bacterium]